MDMISRDVLVGHGTGAAEVATRFLFHNAYLMVWYAGGLLGVGFFVAALARSIFVNMKLIMRRDQESRKEIALSLGLVLSVVFVSFFEGKAAGASTLTVIMYLVTAAVSESVYRRRAESPGTLPAQEMDFAQQVRHHAQGPTIVRTW
jgi:O-antigen ligase